MITKQCNINYDYQKIMTSIQNINLVSYKNICKNCQNYIPINDDRIPIHFTCKRFYELVDFPKAINEICIYVDDKNNVSCMSFIEKE